MIEPLVRPAVPSDLEALDRLEAIARAGLVGNRGGDRLLELVSPRVGRWLSDDVRTVVTDVEGICAGFLVVVPGDVWTIESVFVEAWARELGCGDALIEWAIDAARAAQARRIEGTALPGDRETKNLYERAGVTAKAITVALDLSGPASSVDASQ